MRHKKVGHRVFLRLQRKEEIVSSVTDFLVQEGIRGGSITGLGAVSAVTLRYFSMEDQQYHSQSFEGEFEIASLTGNVSVMDGKIWPHLHIVLAGTDYKAFGGHLESAIVGVTCEIIIEIVEETIEREHDKETGLYLWSF